jgi:indole-3-glycerol phosphate synthase
MSFLADIIQTTRESVEARELETPLEQLKAEVRPLDGDRRFLRALQGEDIALIAEFKRSAPSSKLKNLDASVTDYARAYVQGGASALSILTENTKFGGSLDDLRKARKAVDIPILRKDFVIKESQVYEAVKAGADAILLIAAVLDDTELASLYGLARTLGLDALVEIRDHEELERALRIDADLIGINNRNLETFKVDVETTRKLVKDIPSGITIVSESGLETREMLDVLAQVGVKAALIGSALMHASDPVAKCLEFTHARRSGPDARQADYPAFA